MLDIELLGTRDVFGNDLCGYLSLISFSFLFKKRLVDIIPLLTSYNLWLRSNLYKCYTFVPRFFPPPFSLPRVVFLERQSLLKCSSCS